MNSDTHAGLESAAGERERVLDEASDGFAEYDAAFHLRFLNAAGERMWGRAGAEAMGKSLEAGVQWLNGPEDPCSFFEVRVSGLANGGFFAWFRPAAMRPEAPAAALGASVSEGVLTADARGNILSINAAGLAFFGWHSEAQALRDYREIPELEVLGEDGRPAPPEEGPLGRVLRGEALADTEFRLRQADTGRYWTGSFSGRPVRDEAGRIALAVLAFRDVPGEHDKRRTVSEVAPQHVWRAGPDGGLDYANPGLLQYTGLSMGAVEGDRWLATVHPDDRRAVTEADRAARRSGAEYAIQVRLRRHDGAYRWFLRRAKPVLDGAGRITEWYGTHNDIEDQQRALEAAQKANFELRQEMRRRQEVEQQLLHAQKMEAVGRLAGGVAHDFNNLLTAIGGYAELIRAAVGDNPVLSEYADTLLDAAGRAGALTGQLLALSRRQPAQPRTFHLNEAVRQISRMLQRIIGEDVALLQELDPDLAWIKADRFQIDQVILNLAVNARDAMPNGGRLKIRTENARLAAGAVRGLPAGDYVLLSVSDNGVGMDAATRARIFEPFFTTKPQGKGTGLGLSIVYGIVRQNGGEIVVVSEPGEGAEFRIYLPARPEERGEKKGKVAAKARAARSARVLVVEDDSTVRVFAAEVLRKAGYTVVEARGPAEALRMAQAGARFALVLSDVVMPQMNGPEMAERIRAASPETRLLFMSGYTDGETLRAGVLERGIPFLPKPFTAAALLSRVGEVLGTAAGSGDMEAWQARRDSNPRPPA